MMEYVTKLRLLELYKQKTESRPTIIIKQNPPGFMLETLKFLGYDRTHCNEWNRQKTSYQKLVVCTHRPHFSNEYNPSNNDLRWLRDRMRLRKGQNQSSRYSKVYISREEADRGRKVTNRSQLNDILEKYGFKAFKLETLSFKTQLQIFSEADVIMGPHGAGLVNMLFAEDPTIIELFPESYVGPHFYRLSDRLGFDYRHLITENKGEDLIIDVGKLDILLNDVLK